MPLKVYPVRKRVERKHPRPTQGSTVDGLSWGEVGMRWQKGKPPKNLASSAKLARALGKGKQEARQRYSRAFRDINDTLSNIKRGTEPRNPPLDDRNWREYRDYLARRRKSLDSKAKEVLAYLDALYGKA